MSKWLLIFVLIIATGCSNLTSNEKAMDKEQYYILRGMNRANEGKYLEAIRELNIAYTKNPKNVVTIRELAYCYGELGDLEAAKKLYNEALVIDPKDLIVLKNLAYVNYLQNNYTQAKEVLNNIPERLKDEYTYKLTGYLNIQDKNYDAAYTNLKIAADINRVLDMELIQKYTEVLNLKNRNSELYKYLEKNYSQYNKNADFVVLYAKNLSEKFNEHSKAERVLKRYLAENNKDDDVLLELSTILFQQKKYSEVLEVLQLVSSEHSYDAKYLNYKKLSEERLKSQKK